MSVTIEERTKDIFNAVSADEQDALDTRFQTSNVVVNKALDLLEADGFAVAEKQKAGFADILLLINATSGQQAVITYVNALALLDEAGHDVSAPLIFMADAGQTELPEPEFVADYVAAKLWDEQTPSTGKKMTFGML